MGQLEHFLENPGSEILMEKHIQLFNMHDYFIKNFIGAIYFCYLFDLETNIMID